MNPDSAVVVFAIAKHASFGFGSLVFVGMVLVVVLYAIKRNTPDKR